MMFRQTGKRVEEPGMELVVMRDEKIVVDNLYYDNLAVAAQLGLLPQSISCNSLRGGRRCQR